MSVQHFTQADFEEKVMKSDKPVLVDFWATWCGPCRMLAPVIEALAEEYEGRALVGKVDVDENIDLAKRFGVMSIPTLVVIKDGKVVDKTIGYMPKEQVAALLDGAL